MKLLADAGIYVLVAIADPSHAINRASPVASYTVTNLQHYFRVVDDMARYSNTLGLVVANEVVNDHRSTAAVPQVLRAVTRDLKRYMRLHAELDGEDAVRDNQRGDEAGNSALAGEARQWTRQKISSPGMGRRRRVLPLGYSAPDVAMLRVPMFEYCIAGPEEEAMDFYAFNNFSWMGESSIEISGWNHLERAFSRTPVPVFFSEYGAQCGKPRIFRETATALYTPAMTRTFSGGIVYEFLMGKNLYGLVKLRRLRPRAISEGHAERLDSEREEAKNTQQSTEASQPGLGSIQTHVSDQKGESSENVPVAEDDKGSVPRTGLGGYVEADRNSDDAGVIEVLQKFPDFENLRKALIACRQLRNPPPALPSPKLERPIIDSDSGDSAVDNSAAGNRETTGGQPTATEMPAVLTRPAFPPMSRSWLANSEIPPSPLDWTEVKAQIMADGEWVDVAELVAGMSLGGNSDD
ncbi:Glucanosyltransferase-domain-containing protein [Microdochium trichocladiopsis]|uniref:1,3-beta-glucanosyltransferase n=1 Tax=Microdochium trichocladiopsis TaxID=1682393 RepID=A0A9P8YHA6_9PEZI|nr:Glucanosyltransferase-domain-containing protein [Microdochium trichocladiopsis]KAH7039933.1 Glucanosyltransferase-domain-containing protein [Microdochium trichocladiopsis]